MKTNFACLACPCTDAIAISGPAAHVVLLSSKVHAQDSTDPRCLPTKISLTNRTRTKDQVTADLVVEELGSVGVGKANLL